MNILIVDAEASRQRNLRSILSSIGYKSGDVESMDDGPNAIGALKKKRFDCVFIATNVPRLDGMEMLKEMRGNSRMKDMPVVMFSSEVSRDVVLNAIQTGANAFLSTPFSVSDVELALKQALKKTTFTVK